MKKITVNLSYYNQKDVLIKHIELWKNYVIQNRLDFTFCIIDDCSKIPAYEILKDLDLSNLDIRLYRVKEDLYCNIAGVRNLAATVCETDWMVILDMDTMISNELALEMINLTDTESGNCFKFNRRVLASADKEKHGQIHPAICLLRKDDYWNVGGCDEDLVGHYGQTDPMFWYRSSGKLNVHIMNNFYVDFIPEGGADINRNTLHNQLLFEEKKRSNSWSQDFVRFKWEKLI